MDPFVVAATSDFVSVTIDNASALTFGSAIGYYPDRHSQP
jgi:hypothetical protein